jgi:hypothetical protein
MALRELALVATARGLPKAPDLLAEALRAADSAETPLEKVACWALLAQPVAATDPARAAALLDQALTLLLCEPAETLDRPQALATLVSAWVALRPEDAPGLPGRFAEPGDQRAAALAAAEALAGLQPEAALALARSRPEGAGRAAALARVAALLPDELSAAAADAGLAALAELGAGSDEAADAVRVDVAAALAPTMCDRALEVAAACSTPEARDRALCAAAGRLATSNPQAAVDLLAQLSDPRAGDPVRPRVAAALSKADPQAALALCQGILDRRLLVDALVGVAATLPPDKPREHDSPAPGDTP